MTLPGSPRPATPFSLEVGHELGRITRKSKRTVEDLTGRRFNRFVVIGRAGHDKNLSVLWQIKCDCGRVRLLQTVYVKRSKTCGCHIHNPSKIEIHGTIALVTLNSPGAHRAVIDTDDVHLVSGKAFRLVRGYAYGPQKTPMPNILLNLPKGQIIDHIDGNRLNNRRSNLRPCTRAENNLNRKKKSDGLTSQFKGVYLDGGKWRAAITIKGTRHNLGAFEREADAASAYNEAAKHYHGAFARLNEI